MVDGSNLANTGNGTIDALRAEGLVHGVIIRDFCARNMPGHGINAIPYTRADSSIVNPYSWRIQRAMADTCRYGFVFNQHTDSLFLDLEAINNSRSGYYLFEFAGCHFIACRAEWNAWHGFELHCGTQFNHSNFTDCSTDRNAQNGFYLTDTGGNQPLLFNGLNLRRDGRNGGAGGGGYAAFRVSSITNPIIIDGLIATTGVDDGGNPSGSANSPQYALNVSGSTYVQVSNSFLHGATAGWHDGGSNTTFRRGPNVGEQTGAWDTPTFSLTNNWGTDNSSSFTAAMNTDATAINLTNSVANTSNPLLKFTTGGSGGDAIVKAIVSGDSASRFVQLANGQMSWGSGSASTDTNLYRAAAGVLQSDNAISGQIIIATGKTGATAASRYVGATASGAPSTGSFLVGDYIVDQTGKFYICTTAGSPGTWTLASGTNGNPAGLSGATAATRYVGGVTGAAPSSGTFAVGDFVVDQTNGNFYICTTAGSPGTWQTVGRLTNTTTPATVTTSAGSVGTAVTAARADHTHQLGAHASSHLAGGSDALYLDTQLMTNGEETAHRLLTSAAITLTSGTLYLTYFTARKSETITKLMMSVDSIAASGLTYAALGLYTVDGSGNGTLVASTANDTTAFGSTFSLYSPSLSSSYSKVAGQYYAFAVLCTGTTMPSLTGRVGNSNLMATQGPRLTGTITSQSSLPASYTSGSVTTTGNFFFGAAKP
jgi:hypothetical protein